MLQNILDFLDDVYEKIIDIIYSTRRHNRNYDFEVYKPIEMI